MGYIGNTNSVQNFTPAVDYFNGNGSTTSFTLSRTVGSVFDVQAFIENVPQNPSTAFTVAGNVIRFDSAPPSGTNNIYVRYTSPVTQLVKPAPGTVLPSDISDQLNTSTGYFDLPVGTTAQRPGNPVAGMIRYNTTTNVVETYTGTTWMAVGDQTTSYSGNYLIVAGGGAGSQDRGGGGGAGGYQTGTTIFSVGTSYSVIVGAGGAANGGNGADSSITGLIPSVGGGGGATFANGNAGGSGGGAGYTGGGGSGTAGQGNNGGNAFNNGGTVGTGGGGGGASFTGAHAGNNFGGGGGNGTESSISGSPVTYAGGGGGSFDNRSPGTAGPGGAGGGGSGGTLNANGTAGTANTGGGGGGGSGGIPAMTGGNGGSGIVIISYAGTQRATGGNVTSSGSNTIHTFTSSGTFTA